MKIHECPLFFSNLSFNDFDLSKYFQYISRFTETESDFPTCSKKPEIVVTHSNLVLRNNYLV